MPFEAEAWQDVGGQRFRIISDGRMWRIATIDGASQQWLRLPSRRYRSWRSRKAAQAFIDDMRKAVTR